MKIDNDLIENNLLYVCQNCHILFYIKIQKTKDGYKIENVSLPTGKYNISIDRPKAVCPKCKQENPYNIKIEKE